MKVVVLGGASFGTIELLTQLSRSVRRGGLPPCSVVLYGKEIRSLERIREAASQLGCLIPEVAVECSDDLPSSVPGATHILCQIRPGNMPARARDERFCAAWSNPADEGLGLGGLLAFLRGRSAVAELARRCAQLAPAALFLQMTSPLGLMVGVAEAYFPGRTFGLCELPMTTATRVLAQVQQALGWIPEGYSYAGTNHLGWLYGFQHDGIDVTDLVVGCLDVPWDGMERCLLERFQAVPLPYVRLWTHPKEIRAEQACAGSTRGAVLGRWQSQLARALGAARLDVTQVRALLGKRRMDWYEHGVIPALEALLGSQPRRIVLNVPNAGAMAGVLRPAVVEVSCTAAAGLVVPAASVEQLPEVPTGLVRQVIEYERLASAIEPDCPIDQIAEAVAGNPLIAACSPRRLAAAIRISSYPDRDLPS